MPLRLHTFPLEEKNLDLGISSPRIPSFSHRTDPYTPCPRTSPTHYAPSHCFIFIGLSPASSRSFGCYLEQRSTVSWEIRRGGNPTYTDLRWFRSLVRSSFSIRDACLSRASPFTSALSPWTLIPRVGRVCGKGIYAFSQLWNTEVHPPGVEVPA